MGLQLKKQFHNGERVRVSVAVHRVRIAHQIYGGI